MTKLGATPAVHGEDVEKDVKDIEAVKVDPKVNLLDIVADRLLK